MNTRRPALRAGGTLLTALLISFPHTSAQTSPTLSTLYSFPGYPGDGYFPQSVVLGSGGVLYGTTNGGGPWVSGTVFSLKPPISPGGPWTEAVLHGFGRTSADGAFPSLGLVIGPAGVLYGTTSGGGGGGPSSICGAGCGTVFSLAPPASPGGAWTERVLHRFTGFDGAYPQAGVVIGPGGVLYGTTESGISNKGTVFSLKPPIFPGGSRTHTVVHSFTGLDGEYPLAGVVIGKNGVLYGTTYQGGSGTNCGVSGYPVACGVVFSLTPPASPGASWTESVLHNFTGALFLDAQFPRGVVIGSGGVLYGTTHEGGSGSPCTRGCGTVFSLRPPTVPGGPWAETLIHTFGYGSGEGAFPNTLVIGVADVLYGTTEYGSACGCGTAFQLTPPTSPGGSWSEVVLRDFQGSPSEGKRPVALAFAGPGVLYGATTVGGGASGSSCGFPGAGCGTVFSLSLQ